MDRHVFERLLEAHGAEPDRWPRAAREEALRLCAEDPHARRLWEEFRALENVLDHASPDPGQEEALIDALLDQAAVSFQDCDQEERLDRGDAAEGEDYRNERLSFPSERIAHARRHKVRASFEGWRKRPGIDADGSGPTHRMRWIAAAVMLGALASGIYLGTHFSASPFATTVLAGVAVMDDMPDDPVLLAALDDEDLTGLLQ